MWLKITRFAPRVDAAANTAVRSGTATATAGVGAAGSAGLVRAPPIRNLKPNAGGSVSKAS